MENSKNSGWIEKYERSEYLSIRAEVHLKENKSVRDLSRNLLS